jgi:KaiC/GvpD/RAD55 family RecA-like ATPase
MDKVLTGFSELDTILDDGIPRPSCLSVQTELNWDQTQVTYQLIYNFLQKGLKGLYLCLDRPADEVRQNFQKLNLDITRYDEDYSIFFLDLYEESQKAFVETTTIDVLKYEPNKFLETLTPFLDWIKKGFLIIDSVSTIALNMDIKEAYDLIRGVKMVGRLFNLISIGILYAHAVDTQVVDTICTNADATLTFKGQTLQIRHARGEKLHNATFQITKNADEKINLTSTEPQQENEKILLGLLNKTTNLTLNTQLTLNPTPEVDIPTKQLFSELKIMEQAGILKATPAYSTVTCPRCNQPPLNMYLECPSCGAQLLEKSEAIEHFNCGYIGARSSFEHQEKLVCPKCNKQLKQIGVDYKRAGTIYQCQNKHVFPNPTISFLCTECNEKFCLNEAKLTALYNYKLTDQTKEKMMARALVEF